jgi:hypothetical protein
VGMTVSTAYQNFLRLAFYISPKFLNLLLVQIKAFILLICFSFYFTSGFAAVSCGETKSAVKGCQVKAKTKCPVKCPKPSKNESECCYSCPLLYIATLPSAFTITAHSFLVKKKFNRVQQGEPVSYSASIWKPPNELKRSQQV